ncbi:type IV secretory system conjugative DNA transfer family protein, partial [Rhizobium rhizogenes]
LALPYIAAVAIGIIGLFAANGSANIKAAGLSVLAGNGVVITTATLREVIRLNSIASRVPAEQSVLAYADPVTMIGVGIAFISGMFALRVAIKGNAAFSTTAPKRIGGKRAVHGEADWMKIQETAKLFPEPGGIVIGERYRVDRDSVAAMPFRADDRQSWGAGGKSPLLCFDGSFGSSHGIVFAGSGGFKTTSVTIPTALKWGGGLVVLD